MLSYTQESKDDKDEQACFDNQNIEGLQWFEQIDFYEWSLIENWCKSHGRKNPYGSINK